MSTTTRWAQNVQERKMVQVSQTQERNDPDVSNIIKVSRSISHRSLRVTSSSAYASRVGPIIRVDGDHLLRTPLNGARIRHGRCDSSAGSISRVGERVASSRRRAPIRIVFILLIRNIGAISCGVGVGVGCLRWIVDAIVDGTEDVGVRLAVVDFAVWVGLWWCSVDAEVGRARAESAVLSEVARKVRARVVGARSTWVFLVKFVVVVAGPAIALYHRDSTNDSSKSADDANYAESSSNSSFVREKALRGSASGGSGENGRSAIGGYRETVVAPR